MKRVDKANVPEFYIEYNRYRHSGILLKEYDIKEYSWVFEPVYVGMEISTPIIEDNHNVVFSHILNSKVGFYFRVNYHIDKNDEDIESIESGLKKYLEENEGIKFHMNPSLTIKGRYNVRFSFVGEVDLELEAIDDKEYFFDILGLFDNYIEREIIPIFAENGIILIKNEISNEDRIKLFSFRY